MAKRTRLRKLDFDEIALVPSGDNPHAKVVLSKSSPESEVTKGCGPSHDFGSDGKCKSCGAKRKKGSIRKAINELFSGVADGATVTKSEVVDALLDTLETETEPSKEEDDVSKDDEQVEIDLSTLPGDVQEYITGLESQVEALEKAAGETEEDVDDLDDDELAALIDEIEGDDASVTKAAIAKADPATRELVEKSLRAAKEAQDIAKAERTERERRDFVSKAAAFNLVPGTDDEKGKILQDAYGVSKEHGEAVEAMMKSAQETARESGLFKELGMEGSDTTVSKSVAGKAEELMKADPNLSHEAAVEMVYEQNPDLYEMEDAK